MPVPTRDELRAFIDDPMAEKLGTLDRICGRQKLRHRTVLGALAILFVPATIIITVVTGTDRLSGTFDYGALLTVPPVTLGIAALLYVFVRYRFLEFELPFEYKPDMVAPVVHYIDPRLSYRPNEPIDQDVFEKSAIFQDTIDDYRSNQTYEGSLRTIDLCFGSVRARSTSRKGLSQEVESSFDGLFLVADLPREFQGYTVVIADGDPQGSPLRWTPKEHRQRELWAVDDISLDDHFQVYSTNPDDARDLLLSKEVTDRIQALGQLVTRRDSPMESAAKSALFFVFCDRQLYLARHSPDYFAQPQDIDADDPAHLHQVGDELRVAIDLVELLGLFPNT